MRRWFCAFILATVTLSAAQIETISKAEGILRYEDLQSFKSLFGIQSFLETGTYAGDTTAVASRVYPHVYSVEIFKPLYDRAKIRFATTPNVHLYFGDTCVVLQNMIRDSLPKRLYWLDAHSSGGGTGGTPGFSPILAELGQIYDLGDVDSVILIDDMRGMCHCDSRTNLPLREIIDKIKSVDSHLAFYSIGDIGIIYSESLYPSIQVTDLVKAASISRFFDSEEEDTALLTQLIDAESVIAKTTSKDEEGQNFRKLVGFVNRNELGGEVIYLLWNALYELENKNYTAAINDLRLVANSFYYHWRVDAYLVKALYANGQIQSARDLFQDIRFKNPVILKKILGSAYNAVSK